MLTQNEIDRLKMTDLPLAQKGKKAGQLRPACYHAGGGLYLAVTTPGGNDPATAGGSWLYRYQIAGKPTWLGLGSIAVVSYEQAQRKAHSAAETLADGNDPLTIRDARLATAVAARGYKRTYRKCWNEFVEVGNLSGLKPRTRAGWTQHATDYVLPVIGHVAAGSITTSHVAYVLRPVWYSKPSVGRDLRMEIETVLTFANVAGYRDETRPNPAGVARVAKLLPAGAKPTKASVAHVMVPPAELPAFMAALRDVAGPVARCLELIALTASRKSEIAGLTWAEVDTVNGLITVSADRMKMKGRPAHVIPMSPRVADILAGMTAGAAGDRVWPQSVSGGRALLELLHKVTGIDQGGPDLHGMRATFSTWANDTKAADPHVIEACLAHVKEDKVKAAYDRAEHIEARRALLTKYAAYCGG
jgi:integrase